MLTAQGPEGLAREFLASAPLYQWAQLQNNPDLPPRSPGLYGWFFKRVPPEVPTASCVVREGSSLLYIGISGDLSTRLRLHLKVTAEFSTLRLSLGCLLEGELQTVLYLDDSGYKTFGEKEGILSKWMADNSMIAWITVPGPGSFERHLLKAVGRDLPLNLMRNPNNPFRARLMQLRAKAVQRAKRLNGIPQTPSVPQEPVGEPFPHPLPEQHFRIQHGETGHTYHRIFANYLVDAREVIIEDPFIRARHQIDNFRAFCETVIKASPTVRRINLTTGYDERTDLNLVRSELEELKESLREFDVLLDIKISKTIHDREIRIDNGWTVKIGRGLDFYQRPSGRSAIGGGGGGDPYFRKCLETNVDIFRRSPS